MIDFNMPEIVLLAALAVVIFGPEKLPELARKLARIIAYLRRVGNDARGQLRAELGPEFDDIHLSDLNPKALVAKHLLSGEEVEDLRAIRDEALSTGQLLRETAHDARGGGSTAASPAVGGSTAAAATAVATPGRPRTPFDPEAT